MFSMIFLTALLAVWFTALFLGRKSFSSPALTGVLGGQGLNNIAIESQPAQPADIYENDAVSGAETDEVNVSASRPQLYSNSKYNFTLQLPEEFAVSELTEKNGDIILVQGSDSDASFQIFVMSFEEKEPLTPERIKRNIPDLVIEDPAYIDVDGVEALAFYSQGQSPEKVYEVWMVNKGWLYQVMINANQKEFALEVLKTWRFK